MDDFTTGDNQPLSDDAEENLRIENELMRIKMQAESGAVFGGTADLDPALENEFLRHIQQFETAWRQAEGKAEKIYDLLGRPDFIPADLLHPNDVAAELEKMEKLLEQHSMALDVQGTYEPIVIYRFITEELFEHESNGLHLPGMTTHYIYEEFHPNHELDIRNNVERFMQHWFGQSFGEYSFELASRFALPDGSILPKEKLLTQLDYFFQAYPRFTDDEYTIDSVHFERNNDLGMGHAEGEVEYRAEAENGEITIFKGPYKLYMSNENGGWEIFYFVMPGFNW